MRKHVLFALVALLLIAVCADGARPPKSKRSGSDMLNQAFAEMMISMQEEEAEGESMSEGGSAGLVPAYQLADTEFFIGGLCYVLTATAFCSDGVIYLCELRLNRRPKPGAHPAFMALPQ